MKMTVVPQHRRQLGNELFEYRDRGAREGDRPGYAALGERFDAAGDTIATVDRLPPADADVCLFVDMDFRYLHDCLSADDPPALVYLMREPPSVNPINVPRNLLRYAPAFDRILTWNDDLAESVEKCVKYVVPTYRLDRRDDAAPFEERTLLINVSKRKFSDYPDELYSERERVIQYYDRHHPDDFTLYGWYWNTNPRPVDVLYYRQLFPAKYGTYRGRVDDKLAAYHDHRFAVAFENTTGLRGYVTEKLFDCMRAGIVPVYWGADNVTEYVPEDTFVDYREFLDPAALHEYLAGVDRDEFRAYLDAADRFLSDGFEQFSPERFAETVHATVTPLDPLGPSDLPEDLRTEIRDRARADRLATDDDLSRVAFVREFARLAVDRPGAIADKPSVLYNLARKPLPFLPDLHGG